MIIVNGCIQIQVPRGELYDEYGDPISSENEYGKRFGCNILTRSRDRKGGEEAGQYEHSSYEVLIEAPASAVMYDFVRLYDARDNYLGQFRVQDTQYLDAVGALKIICDANQG